MIIGYWCPEENAYRSDRQVRVNRGELHCDFCWANVECVQCRELWTPNHQCEKS